jgi:CBS domain-containing protein
MRRLQKTIEEIGWTKSVPRFAKGDTVGKAFDAMSRESHDCVLVVENEQLAGIFTSRDFLNRVAAARRDPQTLALGDVMTPAPRTLRPRDNVGFAINWMAIEGFRNVPIVDDAGTILGVLTVFDVMRHLGAVFEDIDATPVQTPPQSDISEVIAMVDLGGGG